MDQPDAENLLCQLVGIESITGHEQRIMILLERKLNEIGARIKRYDMGSGRFNLLASLGNGEPVLCLNAHADTMPPSGDSVPQSTSSDGIVSGLGSCDDKASITAMIMAFSRFTTEKLGGRLDLLISVDEEVSSRGVRTCVERGYRCNYAIVGEPTGLVPITAHSGIIFLDLETRGVGGHGSRPWEGKNAIIEMMDLYRELEALASNFPSHTLVGGSSTNLGIISGGDASNRIPTSCKAKVDVRVMPGMTISEALKRIKSLALDRGASLEVFKKGDPFEAIQGSFLLEKVLKIEKRILGNKIVPMGMRGWTEADPLRNVAGADALVLGPGDIGQAHTEHECVKLEQVEKASEIYSALAEELLKEA